MIYRKLLLITAALPLAFATPSLAQETAPPPIDPALEEQARLQRSRQELVEIYRSLAEKRSKLDELRSVLARDGEGIAGKQLLADITALEAEMDHLRAEFASIALGGIDTSVFDAADGSDKFDWQDELQQVLRPLFDILKELTEKPRAIEHLRGQLEILDSQQQVAEQALVNLEHLSGGELNEKAAAQLQALQQTWRERLTDIERQRKINQLQLENLLGEDESTLEKIGDSLYDFFSGRGLNLLLATSAFLLIWFLMKGARSLLGHLARPSDPASNRYRIVAYCYQMFTGLLSILAALLTLYVVGDFVLLALALVILFALILGLRNYLPRFIAETKLLLNIGSVREGERVLYNGLPWEVRNLNIYSRLYNKELEGLMRVPLSDLASLVSRPYHDDEPWFPTRVGDFVMLGDGSFGQVLRQTPETVLLKTRSSPRTFATTEFLASQPANLSQGFAVPVTFGIDYQHQSICTEEAPRVLHESVSQALAASLVAGRVEDVLVEFKEAGASSLDYIVYVTMNGAAAASYFAIGRIIQRACVEACNAHGWVIPFDQLTVHAGDGFAAAQEHAAGDVAAARSSVAN